MLRLALAPPTANNMPRLRLLRQARQAGTEPAESDGSPSSFELIMWPAAPAGGAAASQGAPLLYVSQVLPMPPHSRLSGSGGSSSAGEAQYRGVVGLREALPLVLVQGQAEVTVGVRMRE